jgi:hypothetical protein
MERNYPKYYSYKSAMEQIDAAISAMFFLEAITIEESILTDRLLRFCRDHGYSRTYDRATLGHELSFIKEKLMDQLEANGFIFLEDLELFWKNRNTSLHQIAKSEPGTPTEDFEKLSKLAELTAKAGKILVKKATNWADKYKRKIMKNQSLKEI